MFQSWSSFLSFKEKVENEERYFYNKDVQEFLNEVMITASERIESSPTGQRYWRAQLGNDEVPCYDFNGTFVDYNPVPYTVKRMQPLPDKAPEGRVNPKGIPYLYLSTDEKTAISEVRPWVGSNVTLVEFETCKNLKLVDCSRCDIDPMNTTVHDLDMLWKLKPPELQEAKLTVWRWIDMAFSKPVDRCDSSADYFSTQIIAELFKKNGFDGVKYRSLFNGGKNIALFYIDSAKQRENSAKVIQITKMDLDFKQVHPFLMKRDK